MGSNRHGCRWLRSIMLIFEISKGGRTLLLLICRGEVLNFWDFLILSALLIELGCTPFPKQHQPPGNQNQVHGHHRSQRGPLSSIQLQTQVRTQPRIQPQTRTQPQPKIQLQLRAPARLKDLTLPRAQQTSSSSQKFSASNLPAPTPLPHSPLPPPNPPPPPTLPTEAGLYESILRSYETGREATLLSLLEDMQKFYGQGDLIDDALCAAGFLALSKNKTEQALSFFNKILYQYPNGNRAPSAQLAKAIILKKMNLHKAAEENLHMVMKNYPSSPESLRAQGELRIIKRSL